MKIISIEETPNPNARKFILDQAVSEQPMSFFNREAAAGCTVAEQLFGVEGVNSLLFLNDFVTINKSSSAKWADIIKKARQILEKKS